MIIFTCAETIITLIYAYYLKNTIHSYFYSQVKKTQQKLKLPNFIKNSSAN